MRRWDFFLGLLLAAGGATTVAAQPNQDPASPARLQLADLERMALAGNPTLVQTRANIQAAQGQALQAGLYPNPTLMYSSEEVGSGGTAGLQGAALQQTIVTAGKLGLRRETHLHEADRRQWLDHAQRMRVINGVRRRFYDLLFLERLVALRTQMLQNARSMRETAIQLKNNGKINRPDELMVMIEARQAVVRLVQAQNARQAAWKELAAFIGRPDLPTAALQDNLDQPRNAGAEAVSLHELMAGHPLLQAAHAEVVRRQAALRQETAEVIPDIDIQAGTQYSFETNNQVAMANVGVRLPIFNRNQGNIAAAEAGLRQAVGELRSLELAISGRYAETAARYQSARVQLDSYQVQLNDVTEAFGLYQEAFAARMASYQQVLMAQQTYLEIVIGLSDAQRELRHVEIELEGLLLTDGRGQQPMVQATEPDRAGPW